MPRVASNLAVEHGHLLALRGDDTESRENVHQVGTVPCLVQRARKTAVAPARSGPPCAPVAPAAPGWVPPSSRLGAQQEDEGMGLARALDRTQGAAAGDNGSFVANDTVRVVRCGAASVLIKHGTRSDPSVLLTDPTGRGVLPRPLPGAGRRW